MLAYRISPDYRLILIRIHGNATIDRVFELISAITKDEEYDPSYQIIVNDKAVKDSLEVNKICQDLDLTAQVISNFFANAGARSANFCYCRS